MGKRKFGRFLLLFFLILAGLIFFNSDFFHVKDYEIVGMENVDPRFIVPEEEILGYNIFHIEKESLIEYAKSDTRIKEIKISRKLPSTLIYYLEPREPLAWVMAGSDFFLVDEEGYSIRKTEEVEELDLPLIKLDEIELEKGVKLDEKNLNFCLNLLENLDPWVLEKISDVVLGQKRNVRLFLHDGGKILLGEAYPADELPGIIGGFLREIEDEIHRLEYLDLRFEGRPVYKLK